MKYCYRDLTQVCQEENCSRWTKGANGEEGDCITNIESRFKVRLINMLIKVVVPMAEAFY